MEFNTMTVVMIIPTKAMPSVETRSGMNSFRKARIGNTSDLNLIARKPQQLPTVSVYSIRLLDCMFYVRLTVVVVWSCLAASTRALAAPTPGVRQASRIWWWVLGPQLDAISLHGREEGGKLYPGRVPIIIKAKYIQNHNICHSFSPFWAFPCQILVMHEYLLGCFSWLKDIL